MRLIDADRLLEWWKPDIGRQFYADQFIHTIEFAPTIEPKHGEWIENIKNVSDLIWHEYECDQCGELALMHHNFCPNCGARMLKGADDE